MHVEWHGQSAFRLSDGERTVVIDPFDVEALRSRTRWDYPAIDVDADVLLITHEHGDHNAAHVVGGDPATVRSTAGTHASPIGPVVAIASEHDEAAGTQRGPNTLLVFDFGGLRVAHLGDLGQAQLRPEQAAASSGSGLHAERACAPACARGGPLRPSLAPSSRTASRSARAASSHGRCLHAASSS